MDLENIKSRLSINMQVLKSQEADFEQMTWTFGAPSFQVTAGDYLVIPLGVWEQIWKGIHEDSACSSTEGKS